MVCGSETSRLCASEVLAGRSVCEEESGGSANRPWSAGIALHALARQYQPSVAES